MVQCPIHRNRKVVLYIIKGHMKVISGLLLETWGYFRIKKKNFISTTRNCHSHSHENTHFILFALLKVLPRFFSSFGLWAPSTHGPRLNPPPPPPSLSVGMRSTTLPNLRVNY